MEQNSPQSSISETATTPVIVDADGITQYDGRDSKVVIKEKAPNTEAKISAATNGFFNGISIAAVPMSAVALGYEWKDGKIGTGKVIWTAVATVALGAAGTIWGLVEAKKLKSYRDTIADEVGRLEDRLECLERAHAKPMAQREEERKQNPSSPAIS